MVAREDPGPKTVAAARDCTHAFTMPQAGPDVTIALQRVELRKGDAEVRPSYSLMTCTGWRNFASLRVGGQPVQQRNAPHLSPRRIKILRDPRPPAGPHAAHYLSLADQDNTFFPIYFGVCYSVPMTDDLRSSLHDLANHFADSVLAAIRGASLEDLVSEQGGDARRRPGARHGGTTAPESARSAGRTNGRLVRRSPEDIAKALERVVVVVRKSTGMRSEEIRKVLKLDTREVPRILHEGLKTKKLKSKGHKRATVYSVA